MCAGVPCSIPSRRAVITEIASIQVVLQDFHPVLVVIWIGIAKDPQVSEVGDNLIKYLQIPFRIATVNPILFTVLLQLT